MRRRTQRYSQAELNAQAQATAYPKLNQAVTDYLAGGWKVFGIHTNGAATVVCVSKAFGNVGGAHAAVVYPNGRCESFPKGRATWSWTKAAEYAAAERSTQPAERKAARAAAPAATASKAEAEAVTKEQEAFRQRMSTITVPAGFTTEVKEAWGAKLTFTLKSPEVEIKFDQTGSGHTRFKVADGWKTFDRLGVEDSFYHIKLYDGDDRNLDLDAMVREQLERIAASREYYASAVAVPGLPFTVAPEKIAALQERLRSGGSVSFTPSGFGTGYVVSKRPQRQCRYGETRASKELCAFFGEPTLYVSTFDCD